MSDFTEPYLWRCVADIVPGDIVHRWGDDLLVLESKRLDKMHWAITVEETDGTIKTWRYGDKSELIVKPQEDTDE